MKFELSADAFHDVVSDAGSITPSNPAMVAYSGVFIAADGDAVEVTGSDGETTVTSRADAAVTRPGRLLVPPAPLLRFLGTVDADRVTVELVDGDLSVTPAGMSGYRFRPIAATFPQPPTATEGAHRADLSRLPAALAATKAAHSKDYGVQLVSTSEGLTLHTTDSYRLHRAQLPEAGFGTFTGECSLTALERVVRADATTSVTVDDRGRSITFFGPRTRIVTRLLAPQFPAVGDMLSMSPPHAVTLPAAAIRAGLGRLAAIADTRPVQVEIEGAKLTMSVMNEEIGTGSETIGLAGPAPAPYRFAVNLAYLNAAIGAHHAAAVTLGWFEANQPLMLTSDEPFGVTALLMPVQLT